jgi:outer membrane protein TolC
MNNRINKLSIIASAVILLLFNSITDGQVVSHSLVNSQNDSLTIKEILQVVITTHPTVKIAEEAINNANNRIAMARTGYYPEADLTAGFTNMGPVTKLTIPEMGTFRLFPENNYSASLNYRQVVYDFGRTKQNIEIETEGKVMGEQVLEQVKQKLSLFTVNTYYSLLFLQSAIKIKEAQVAALNEHLSQVEKMISTGSATEYQLLSTKVKISTVESQKVDLTASLTAQQASMNSLLGNDNGTTPVVKSEFTVSVPDIPSDSLLSYAFHNRDEMILYQERASLAELKYGITKLQNKPVISLQASAGAKNGYVPNLGEIRPNYVIGLGIRIPVFDGMKGKYNILLAQSAITSLSYESDYARRTISNELYEAVAFLTSAQQKVNQFKLQLEQAEKANSLAETSFRSGMITNLDLLDASTSVSESRLLLLKAKIEYAVSIYKLKDALGERIY